MELTFTSVDWIILGLLLLSGLFGWIRGLIKEIFSIAGWAAAFLALYFGFEPLQPVTRDFIHNTAFADFTTGTLLFAGTLIVVSFITHYVSKWVKRSAFGAADRSLGFLFGLIRAVLIICMGFFFYTAIEMDRDEFPEPLKNAWSLPYVDAATNFLIELIKPPLTETEEVPAEKDSEQT